MRSRPASPTPRSPSNSNTLTARKPWSITNLTVDLPGPAPSAPRAGETLPPARWRTKEFYVYYVVFAVALPFMVKVVVDLSRETHPNYPLFAHRLSKGWMFGWKVDTSDHQWNVFRSNLPILGALIILWTVTSTIFNFFFPSPTPSSPSAPVTTPRRATFILCFTIPLLIALHGTSVPKMFLILWLNYRISKTASWGGKWTKAAPFVGWGFNLVVLFANEIYGGYQWGTLSDGLAFLDADSLKGILPRWHINWNITMLRLISFNMDYYWACTASDAPPLSSEKPSASPSTPTERSRSLTSHPMHLYSFPLYLAYALYPPLYLAGPLLSYNSFLSQLITPPTIPRRLIASYAARFVACLLTMELVLHSMYVVAIKDESRRGAWAGTTPFELSMVGFWNLIVVWLKLLIPWRFFRLWSLLDGVDPPENMIRCMANNYSTSGFWRSWHRSYNLWIVRYLYVPLGGASHAFLSTLVVFTFVALWHDLSLRLLTWGWVISLFVLPEMIAKRYVPASAYGSQPWYRHIAAIGGVFNVLMMMTANLIGFAIGTEGMRYMWSQMIGTSAGIKFMVVANACLFVAVQIMFEYREEERRQGILRRF